MLAPHTVSCWSTGVVTMHLCNGDDYGWSSYLVLSWWVKLRVKRLSLQWAAAMSANLVGGSTANYAEYPWPRLMSQSLILYLNICMLHSKFWLSLNSRAGLPSRALLNGVGSGLAMVRRNQLCLLKGMCCLFWNDHFFVHFDLFCILSVPANVLPASQVKWGMAGLIGWLTGWLRLLPKKKNSVIDSIFAVFVMHSVAKLVLLIFLLLP